MATIKALSLTQPWASLIALGEKRVETRSWPTRYTGLLAIHASKGFPRWAQDTCNEEPFRTSLRPSGNYVYPSFWCGHVLCIVKVIGCRRTEDVVNQITDKERAFGDYGEGRYAWFLEFVQNLKKPVPAVGHLGLWDIDIEREALAPWRSQPEGEA